MTRFAFIFLLLGSIPTASAVPVDTSGFLYTREVCNARGYHLPPFSPAVGQWLAARQREGADVSRARVEGLIGRYGESLFCWYVDSQQSR